MNYRCVHCLEDMTFSYAHAGMLLMYPTDLVTPVNCYLQEPNYIPLVERTFLFSVKKTHYIGSWKAFFHDV